MTVRRPPGTRKAATQAKKKQTTTRKPAIRAGSTAAKGRELLKGSYGGDVTSKNTAGGTGAVMDYYKGLTLKDRKKAFRDLARKESSRTSGLTGVLFQDLPTEARAAYSKARGPRGGVGASSGGSAGKVAPWENLDAPTGTLMLGKPEKEEGSAGGGKKKKGKSKGKGGRSKGGRKGQTIRTNKPRRKK
jgi:hypothetical protein